MSSKPPSRIKKYVSTSGLYVVVYRKSKSRTQHIIARKLVEPAWLSLWFLATEGQWDESLWDQLSDSNKNWFSYCYHIAEYPLNKHLEIAIAKQFKKTQERLVLLEGMIEAGNISHELVKEVGQILDSLVDSDQIPKKQATRIKSRIDLTWKNMQTKV